MLDKYFCYGSDIITLTTYAHISFRIAPRQHTQTQQLRPPIWKKTTAHTNTGMAWRSGSYKQQLHNFDIARTLSAQQAKDSHRNGKNWARFQATHDEQTNFIIQLRLCPGLGFNQQNM